MIHFQKKISIKRIYIYEKEKCPTVSRSIASYTKDENSMFNQPYSQPSTTN